MLEEKRNPFSRLLHSASATLALPFHSAAGAAAAGLAYFRGSRERTIDSSQAAALARVDTRKWTAQLLKQLEWRRFEELCVAYFEALGCQASIARSATHAGVDIHLVAQGAQDAPLLAQCKAWDAYRVGIKGARELRSAMTAAGLDQGVLLTSGRFTQEAARYAREQNIELIDGAELLTRIAALAPEKALALLKYATQGDFLTPTCPNCSIKMISRKSTREGRKFWGCRNYPRCKQIFAGAVPT
jgi:restriction system protein